MHSVCVDDWMIIASNVYCVVALSQIGVKPFCVVVLYLLQNPEVLFRISELTLHLPSAELTRYSSC